MFSRGQKTAANKQESRLFSPFLAVFEPYQYTGGIAICFPHFFRVTQLNSRNDSRENSFFVIGAGAVKLQ